MIFGNAISLIAGLIPQTIATNLNLLRNLIHDDSSTIIRDYAVDAVGHYAGVSATEAEKAYLILKEALYVGESKHAKQALHGLKAVALHLPEEQAEIRFLVSEFTGHKKGVVRKAAEAIIKDLSVS
jgi:ribulose 1,5-bisphosphate synthetase/thiazole synthase